MGVQRNTWVWVSLCLVLLAAGAAHADDLNARPWQAYPGVRVAMAPTSVWPLYIPIAEPGRLDPTIQTDLGLAYRIYLGDRQGLAVTPELGYTYSTDYGHGAYLGAGVGYYYTEWLGVGWYPRVNIGSESFSLRHGLRIDTFHGSTGIELAHQAGVFGAHAGRHDLQIILSVDGVLLVKLIAALAR